MYIAEGAYVLWMMSAHVMCMVWYVLWLCMAGIVVDVCALSVTALT